MSNRFLKALPLTLLAATLVRIIQKTLRWKFVDRSGPDGSHWADQEPTILVFWHGQQLLMPWAYLPKPASRSKRLFALISQHADGRFAAKAMEYLSIPSVAGSSNKHGLRALLELKRVILNGDHVAITPDGPKGPHSVAKAGAVKLAEISGARLLPAAISVANKWQFRSWDKMFLPKPFSPAAMVLGEKIQIPANLSGEDLQTFTVQLTETLNALTKEADALTAAS
jgi:lysophospholipid acyltransferase (LPLAT)-like uncharacterized protein